MTAPPQNYDVIIGWRGCYCLLESGTRIDPSGETAEGETFVDLAAFQKITLAKPNRIARPFVMQMRTYTNGSDLILADRANSSGS